HPSGNSELKPGFSLQLDNRCLQKSALEGGHLTWNLRNFRTHRTRAENSELCPDGPRLPVRHLEAGSAQPQGPVGRRPRLRSLRRGAAGPLPAGDRGEHNIPWLLHLPGSGSLEGEVYTVDERMLRFLDDFENCPALYQRTALQVELLEGGPGRRSRRRPLRCSASCTAGPPSRRSGLSSRTTTATTPRGRTGCATTPGRTDKGGRQGGPTPTNSKVVPSHLSTW
uniref:Gamma-glutamylaminecyclotransferase n=1 Tax=Macaca fascicularis TaxID=9541 RepID=A0A7N9D0S6_MACFA